MAKSARFFQDDLRKNSTVHNEFIRPKEMVRAKVVEGKRRDLLIRWITFFRRNPMYFIRDYFGIKLHPFQILMIWALQKSELAYIVASRASSKTWIIAVWCLTLAVLYPGIKIVICSKTLKQGGLILSEKITSLMSSHTNVSREVRTITTNSNIYECIFHCGSTIKVVPSGENARGGRSNYTVIEESRLVPKDILEQVIVPMSEVRSPPYRMIEPYASDPRLKEEGRISYITSAGYVVENWFEKVQSCIRRMADGDESSNFIALDYLITIFHNIKTESMIKNEMQDMDSATVQMEYLNIPAGTSGKSYYRPNMFKRNLKQAFYPQREDTYNPKKNPYELKKVDGEVRMISVDIATRANKSNDNSIVCCIRMIPLKGKGYERHMLYMESHKGQHVGVQAKRIKEIFTDFEADYIVIDLQNSGVGVFDSLSEPTLCEERGITFPAMTVVDEIFDCIKQEFRDELRTNHTRGINAMPIIFPISATQSINSQIANYFRSSLQKGLWRFLIQEGDAEEYLSKSSKGFIDNSDSANTVFYVHPYLQTSLMVGECINLDMSLSGGMVKLVERAGCYKDRYSCISYANYIITTQFDKSLLKEPDDTDEFSEIASLVQFA